MEGGENQIQTRSRASRKRPNQSAEEENPMTKKRVVLGEITNISSNVTESKNSSEAKIRKLKPESDLDKTGNEANQEVAVSPGSGSDEPRRYGFAPSMLQYLRSVEVLYYLLLLDFETSLKLFIVFGFSLLLSCEFGLPELWK